MNESKQQSARREAVDVATIELGQIAHARSGDKGGHANVGVIAYTSVGYHYLLDQLTVAKVAEFFAGLQPSKVERFELPGIHALNFLLYGALGEGASNSLRTDSQGKILGLAIRQLQISRPANLAEMVAANRSGETR